jgi:hypothetical protein
MISRSALVCRTPDSWSVVQRVVRQRNVQAFSVVYRNNLEGGPASVNDGEAGAFPHALDHVRK